MVIIKNKLRKTHFYQSLIAVNFNIICKKIIIRNKGCRVDFLKVYEQYLPILNTWIMI